MKMRFEILILLCLQVSGVLSQEDQRFPNSLIVDKGQIAYIPCQAHNEIAIKETDCIWSWNGHLMPLITHKYFFNEIVSDGDCGITIFDAQLDEDDGLWKCEIKFQNETVFTSLINVVVAEAPTPPVIVYESKNESTFEAGQPYFFACLTNQSNPPTVLTWFLNDQDITIRATQTDLTEPGHRKTWTSISVLDVTFDVKDFNKTLKCTSRHNGFEPLIQTIEIKPNITYPPQVTLSTNLDEDQDVVEGTFLVLKCEVNANPEAIIIWKKFLDYLNHSKEELVLDKVRRQDAGSYTCLAKNSLGISNVSSTVIDVKYGPELQEAYLLPRDNLTLYDAAVFVCKANGNPGPRYSWSKKVRRHPEEWKEISTNSTLQVEKMDYEWQGTYVCIASNFINGQYNITKSEEIVLDITGPPQIIVYRSSAPLIALNNGESTTISVYFCSDPPPFSGYWILPSGATLKVNTEYHKYSAYEIKPIPEHNDCYKTRLTMTNAKHHDSGTISFITSNHNGTAKYATKLAVEGLGTDMIGAIATTTGVMLLVMIGFAIFQLRKNRQNMAEPVADVVVSGGDTGSTAQILPTTSSDSSKTSSSD